MQFKSRGFNNSLVLIGVSMLASFSTALFAADEVKTEVGVSDQKASTDTENTPYSFPEWPEKVKVEREDLPPPPPLGPYMSTALNGQSTGQPRFAAPTSSSKDTAPTPMATFSPDLPWPGDDKKTKRWQPEKPQAFVRPDFMPGVKPTTSGATFTPPSFMSNRPVMPVERKVRRPSQPYFPANQGGMQMNPMSTQEGRRYPVMPRQSFTFPDARMPGPGAGFNSAQPQSSRAFQPAMPAYRQFGPPPYGSVYKTPSSRPAQRMPVMPARNGVDK